MQQYTYDKDVMMDLQREECEPKAYTPHSGSAALSARMLLSQVKRGEYPTPDGIECISFAIRDLTEAQRILATRQSVKA